MGDAATARQSATLRRATAADLESVASVWFRGWSDGHRGHVPTALVAHRQLADFRDLAARRLAAMTVATVGADVVGFVVQRLDEIEQLYVDAAVRGSGVADVLLQRSEEAIAATYRSAWLAVVAGNSRARRFYERNGWANTGAFEYPAETSDHGHITVPALRYRKQLASQVVPAATTVQRASADNPPYQWGSGQGTAATPLQASR